MGSWKKFEKKAIEVLQGLTKIIAAATVVAVAGWGLWETLIGDVDNNAASSTSTATREEVSSSSGKQPAFYQI